MGLAGSCQSDVPPPADWTPPPTPAEFRAGQAVFERHCLECHGASALGSDRGPPLVHPVYEPTHHADVAFVRAVELGVRAHHWRFGPMAPVPDVTRAQVDAIVTYVRWLQREAGIY